MKASCFALPRFLGGLALIWVALAGTGCTAVKPWQRGILADPVMNRDRDPLGTTFTEHMFFSREGTSGGQGVGGGGCGCN